MADKVKRASYSLEDEYVELLKEIAWRGRRSATDELRLLIDARAQVMGLTPVRPIDPKSSALIGRPKTAALEPAGI